MEEFFPATVGRSLQASCSFSWVSEPQGRTEKSSDEFFLAEKTATAQCRTAEDVHAHYVLRFHRYVIMQALTIPRATDTSRVY